MIVNAAGAGLVGHRRLPVTEDDSTGVVGHWRLADAAWQRDAGLGDGKPAATWKT
ncbi:MAG: hypothetical protein QOJ80_1586 [Mycobacterium sp.]|jgi:hypothetical protein|nr:hypothetical protein [Mycobacterium sp.]